jgi:hypothetical protein
VAPNSSYIWDVPNPNLRRDTVLTGGGGVGVWGFSMSFPTNSGIVPSMRTLALDSTSIKIRNSALSNQCTLCTLGHSALWLVGSEPQTQVGQ